MNTSSRKKGILPVRLGIEPDTKTALSDLNMDTSLADTMSGRELDLLIIDNEYKRILEYYDSKDRSKEGKYSADKWKSYALKQIKKN